MHESAKFQELYSFYNKNYARFDIFFEENEPTGAYVFSDFNKALHLFHLLFEEKIISKNQSFLDAGCGDSRIVALASFLGLNSYGIELGDSLSLEAIDIINQLYSGKILEKKPSIVQGDFLDDSTYINFKKGFSDFEIIFNFHTEVKKLINKVKNQARNDVILILCLLRKSPLKIEKFEIIKTFKVDTPSSTSFYVYKRNN